MLLLTTQSKNQVINYPEDRTSTLSKFAGAQDERLLDMMSTMSLEHRHCFMLIMQQNSELKRTIDDMKRCLVAEKAVAPQVLLSSPIILLDPLSKSIPFHLEFVDSAECFLAVLKTRFANAGVQEKEFLKLDREEFVIEHSKHQISVNMTGKWDRVWRPGGKYDMRMVFHRFVCPPTICPACQDINEGQESEIWCKNCGLEYRQLSAIGQQSRDWDLNLPEDVDVKIEGEEIPYILQHPKKKPELKVFRPCRDSDDELYDSWRRVQIVEQSVALFDKRFPTVILLEDFARFAELVKLVPEDVSAYQADIEELGSRAVEYNRVKHQGLPAFASFA